jgi:FADH2 O2-dependent halogenase
MDAPAMFKRLSLLYFAAASYSETARRLGRPDLAPGFLLSAHSSFGPELGACADLALDARSESAQQALESRIDRAIEPFDAAGLRDRSRRDWYPVLASDLIESADRFKTTPDDIVERLPYLFAVPR